MCYKLILVTMVSTIEAQNCVIFEPKHDFTVYRLLWEKSNITCKNNDIKSSRRLNEFNLNSVIEEFKNNGDANCIQGKMIGINLHSKPCISYDTYDNIHGKHSFMIATKSIQNELTYINRRKLQSNESMNNNAILPANCTTFEADRGCMSRGFCNNDGSCSCNTGYYTYKCSNGLQCCFAQKKQWIAFVMAWFTSSVGGPWWYVGLSGIAGGILGGCLGTCCLAAFCIFKSTDDSDTDSGCGTGLFSCYVGIVTLVGLILTGTNKLKQNGEVPLEHWRRLNEKDDYKTEKHTNEKVLPLDITAEDLTLIGYSLSAFIVMFVLTAIRSGRKREHLHQ